MPGQRPQTDRKTRREKRPPKPLDGDRLEELALHYVSRYATTKAKLVRYLDRKLHARGWDLEASGANLPILRKSPNASPRAAISTTRPMPGCASATCCAADTGPAA